MKHFRLFNPEHDLALANGDKHFIAPKNIRDMARDLASLLEVMDCDHPVVWGWDSAIKEQLLRSGIPQEKLPTDTALAALRTQSERKTAHHVLYSLRSDNATAPYVGESYIIRHTDEIDKYAAQHGHIILKDPLSSSGRGLRHVKGDLPDNSWAEALIRRHGYLTAEPYYDKVQDFAMEFYADGGGCHFIGYSLFTTNPHGRYESNALMGDDKIESILSRYVPCTALHELQAWVIEYSSLIIPTEWDTARFPLHFGIDMMVVCDRQPSAGSSAFKIHPCVEINLRLNMGIIAHEVCRRLLAPGTEGRFCIAAFPTPEALQTFHDEQTEKSPSLYRNDRLVGGYHPLTPIRAVTRYHAYLVACPMEACSVDT